MKIRQLFLKAFGPFTNTTLDFSGSANLHVIYGPNEAGKSSALRAMADLRYGFHARSTDGFNLGPIPLAVAGVFEDGAGRTVSLARRKGNKNTLLMSDPMTGDPIVGSQVAPDVLLALTGGVAREQFVTMYGLDSKHLRAGGDMLIRGEGELGAALFEASTGSAGIKAILETLQNDARKYFAPRGTTTVLVEAARQLDEAKQRYKQALTKPEQWKALNRAHEDAVSRLADVRMQLAGQRRRQAELTELRVVEPLLRQLDQASNEWAEVQGYVALPVDARERRLAVLQKQLQANTVLLEADEVLAQCQEEAQTIHVEALLLTHATAIDRLATDLGAVRQGTDTRVRLGASTEAQGQQLLLQAVRMTESVRPIKSLDELFRQLLSAADQTELEGNIAQFQAQTLELQHARAQLRTSGNKLESLQRETMEAPAAHLQQALSLALKQAQSLGDAEKRLAELLGSRTTEQRKLDRNLADLGFSSAEQLKGSRGLAASEIDTFEREHTDLSKRLALSADKVTQIEADLLTQQHRHTSLAAAGEVVTADTLKSARLQRDVGWQGIRAAYIDRAPGAPDPSTPGLPAAFERSQSDADRQADLLREGAERAAEVAECEQRITEMTLALTELKEAQEGHTKLLAALDVGWKQALAAVGVPHGTAAQVRAWLTGRQSALDQLDRLTDVTQEHADFALEVTEASNILLAALLALDQSVPENAHYLATLITLGAACERELVEAKVAMTRRAKDIKELAQEVKDAQEAEADLSEKLLASRGTLDAACHQLFLAMGITPETIKARLAELQRWGNDYQMHDETLTQLKQLQASEEAVSRSAKTLGELLQETDWVHLDAWFDDLSQRLALSRDAQTRRNTLNGTVVLETRRRKRAQDDLEAAAQSLALLMQQAGVQDAEELPDAEAQSELRRDAARQLDALKSQLNRTSTKDAATLRADLVDLDSVAIEQEKQACVAEIERLEGDEKSAITAEQETRLALAAVDTSDEAAHAREEMEAAIARYRAGVRPWAQLKLAHALLDEALRRYREKAQGPLVESASEYFKAMTGGRFVGLRVDDDSGSPVLKAKPAQGTPVSMEALSEGTADQLYLALRLAALQVQRQPDRMMPLVLDDVFMTSDDERATHVFQALEKFAAQGQVLVFTHHQHLVDIASRTVQPGALRVHQLPNVFERSL
ncbi:MAG: AAA family ATPase [Burkholderiaceae bacterium]|nr:AAA family ATPase [Burkholderiaceae bacterium]